MGDKARRSIKASVAADIKLSSLFRSKSLHWFGVVKLNTYFYILNICNYFLTNTISPGKNKCKKYSLFWYRILVFIYVKLLRGLANYAKSFLSFKENNMKKTLLGLLIALGLVMPLMTGCDTAEFGEDQEEGFEEDGLGE